jgi:hypothetical protein
MSTKTTLKRLALVAVSALGFGLVSVVTAPVANAAQVARNVVTSVSLSSGSAQVARVGQSYERSIKITTGSAGAADATVRVNVKFTQVPSGDTVYNTSNGSAGAISGTLTAGSASEGTLTSGSAITIAATPSSSATAGYILVTPGSGANVKAGVTTAQAIGQFSFTPRAAGTYKVLAWADNATSGNTDGDVDSGEASTTLTIVVGDTPSAITLTTPASTVATGSASFTAGSTGAYGKEGALVVVTMTDAAGNPTRPIAGESISITAGSGTAVQDASFTAGDFDASGMAATNIMSDTAGTVTVTAAGVGGISSLTSKSLNLTFTAATYAAITAGTITNTTGVSAITDWSAGTSASPTGRTFAEGKASVTFKFTASTAGGVAPIQIRDVSGVLSGKAGAAWSVPVDLSTGSSATLTIATAGFAEDDLFQLGANMSTDGYIELTAAAPVLDATNSTLTPATSSIVTGGGVTLTAVAKDQFGQPLAASVSWSVAGRNATTVPSTVLADANGTSTYTLTDTSTSTTSLTSTVTATMSYDGSTNAETASVTFGAGNAVGTITVTTSPTLTVSTTESSISTAASGPANGAVTLAFTVKDENGVVLVGVPVTFTSSLAESGFASSATDTVDRKLAYTGTDGVATTYVYGWKAPASTTVTATAGGKSVTTTVNFVPTAASARKIAVAVSGSVVTATVQDRYGNPVKSATVTWSRTGTGFFGGGVSATTSTTDVNGVTEIQFSGTGVVKAELDVTTYTQADDAVGYVGTTATTGVGASLAPAGVASATASVTATDAATAAAEAASDAAAEAIDAANAATDAANLAAEAADAATVAAEEARDAADAATAAVEELATQVATLMAALKAQITTLANTVAKIAKKVKA